MLKSIHTLWPYLLMMAVIFIAEFVFGLTDRAMLVLIFILGFFLMAGTRYIERRRERQTKVKVGYMVHPPLDGR